MKKGTPTNAASPIPRAARRTSRDMNEEATDCVEALRPHDATHVETMRTLSTNQEAKSNYGIGNEHTYGRCAGESLSTTGSSIRKGCR